MVELAIIATLGGIALVVGSAAAISARRWPHDEAPLVEAIERLLPQTQCAQCGYPGCRPYAQAVAGGEALDLCPPGGEATYLALTELMGAEVEQAPQAPAPVVARIVEAQCIGCTLCIEACPVDAIVGAPQHMHTVLESACTGCELCLPPCPVDCIELDTVPQTSPPVVQATAGGPCIQCGDCLPVCPVNLDPADLWWLLRADDEASAIEAGLNRCIECGLCDRACPAELPLAAQFGVAQAHAAAAADRRDAAQTAKLKFEARLARLAARQQRTGARRVERLAARRAGPERW